MTIFIGAFVAVMLITAWFTVRAGQRQVEAQDAAETLASGPSDEPVQVSGPSADARYIVKHLWIVAVFVPLTMAVLSVLLVKGLQ